MISLECEGLYSLWGRTDLPFKQILSPNHRIRQVHRETTQIERPEVRGQRTEIGGKDRGRNKEKHSRQVAMLM